MKTPTPELLPRGSGKSIMMQKLLDEQLDRGMRVAIIFNDGVRLVQRKGKFTRIQWIPRHDNQA